MNIYELALSTDEPVHALMYVQIIELISVHTKDSDCTCIINSDSVTMLLLLDVIHINFSISQWFGILACDQYYHDIKNHKNFTTMCFVRAAKTCSLFGHA